MIKDLQAKVSEQKRIKDAAILAHSYVAKEITEIADYTGDSYILSVKAKNITQRNIIVCGVRFMAETVKMLNPEKNVFLANADAGCPMAEQFPPEHIAKLKAEDPFCTVVCYINTTAAIKELCDVCVTSSSAVNVVSKIPSDNILFIPDANLGTYVKNSVKDKQINIINGCCPVHNSITLDDLAAAKKKHPDAMVLVHPECKPEITEKADYVGSTTGIINYAQYSDHKDFIIGTENSICELLQYQCPDKNFYPLSKKLVCPDMKLTTLYDVYNTLRQIGIKDSDACEITLTKEQITHAKKCIDEMLKLSE